MRTDRHGASRRICLVTETYPPEINGVALTVARLAAELRGRGHAVSVVCPRRPRSELALAGRAAELGVTRVPGLALPCYPDVRVGLPAVRALAASWTAARPDAVYVATEGPLGWSAVRAARRAGVPVWSGFHTRFHDYAAHYGGRWLRAPALVYLRWLHNRTRGTLVGSAALRAELVAARFSDVSVVGRGVDSVRFGPSHRSSALRRAWGAGDGDLVALSVGRLAVEKNIPLAVDAYRAMRRAHASARLVIVGDGPTRRQLERAHPDALFCGMRTGDDLAAHYASADVFLFPSETETFGNVTLEAMASGLAVVAYDYAAAGAHVDDGVSGVLVPRADAAAFLAAVAELARHPERLPGMRRAARSHAETVGWDGVVDQFERFLGVDGVADERPAETAVHTMGR